MSLVLVYERVCKEAVWHTCSQGDIIEMEEKFAKIDQAIQDVLRGLNFTYCFDSRLNSPWASSTSFRGLAI